MRTKTPTLLCAAIAVLGSITACDTPLDGELDAGIEVGPRLYGNTSYYWPGEPPMIPVCWENPAAASAERRGWVRDAIQSNWTRYARVNFVQWDTCTSDEAGLHINIQDARSSAPGGVLLDGVDDGMTLNLSYDSWGPDWCRQNEANREHCVRAVALHEFGHVLGFHHEEERPDYVEPPGLPAGHACEDQDWDNPNPHPLGAYDVDSVMSYCGQPFDDPASWKTTLSPGDIAAVQSAYGRRIAGSTVSTRGACMAAHADAPNGADVFMWDCDEAHDDQEWIRDGDHLMLAPNRCMETGGGVGSDGRLWSCDSFSMQDWAFENIQVRGWGGLCLDLQNGDTTPWTNIQMWDCDALGGANQEWTITDSGEIRFGGPGSDSCVTAYAGQVFIHSCDYPYYQQFDFLPGGEIRPRNQAGLCLDVQAWTTAEYLAGNGLPGNGDNVQTFSCWADQLNQKWNFTGRVHQSSSNLCLDRENNGTHNGTRVQSFTCNETSAQVWDYYFK
ncbi:MAG: ricin-type beta-trefoil lectin domain protein [Myxococcota bacterium]